MIQWGLQNADIVYVQNNESYDFLVYAKENDRKLVIDVNANPLYRRVVASEALRHSTWSFISDSSLIEKTETYFKRSGELSDVLICPSDWVAEGVIIYWSEEDGRYVVEALELPDCMADGMTYEEAIKNAEVVISEWIQTARTLGREIPQPKGRLAYA
jgi:predicted RNase H-like HicB family nuclease